MPHIAARTQVLDYLRRHGRTSPLKLAGEVGLSRDAIYRLLDVLMDQGEVYSGEGGYELAQVRVRVHAVDAAHEGRVLTHLTGRKDTASGVAKGTGLTPDLALATCEALLGQGRLLAMSVGSLRLYVRPAGATS